MAAKKKKYFERYYSDEIKEVARSFSNDAQTARNNGYRKPLKSPNAKESARQVLAAAKRYSLSMADTDKASIVQVVTAKIPQPYHDKQAMLQLCHQLAYVYGTTRYRPAGRALLDACMVYGERHAKEIACEGKSAKCISCGNTARKGGIECRPCLRKNSGKCLRCGNLPVGQRTLCRTCLRGIGWPVGLAFCAALGCSGQEKRKNGRYCRPCERVRLRLLEVLVKKTNIGVSEGDVLD